VQLEFKNKYIKKTDRLGEFSQMFLTVNFCLIFPGRALGDPKVLSQLPAAKFDPRLPYVAR
jgi:hypothetical protein